MRRLALELLTLVLFAGLLVSVPRVLDCEGEVKVTAEDYIKTVACLVAYHEEHDNGINGMIGVLFVIRNRALHNWQGGDWLAIMREPGQFAGLRFAGEKLVLVHYPDPREPGYQKLLQVVDDVYDGRIPDITNGAQYFADLGNPDYKKFGWFDTYIVRDDKHPRCAQIGTTTYFK